MLFICYLCGFKISLSCDWSKNICTVYCRLLNITNPFDETIIPITDYTNEITLFFFCFFSVKFYQPKPFYLKSIKHKGLVIGA